MYTVAIKYSIFIDDVIMWCHQLYGAWIMLWYG